MSVLFQETVAADAEYSVENQAGYITFDLHNDTPFNVGLSFGHADGIANADYFTTPHTILSGIPAPQSRSTTLSVKPIYQQTLYIYTQTPSGGGGVDSTSAPALSITLIGYTQGQTPASIASLNRMITAGNVVPISSSALYLQNHGDALGTKIISITDQSDNVGDTFSVTNEGIITIGNAQYSGGLSLGGNALIGSVAGVGCSISNSGIVKAPTYDIGGSSLSAISFFSGTVGTSLTSFTHGLVDVSGNPLVPDFVFIQITGTAAGKTISYDPSTITSSIVKLIASAASTTFVAYAVKK